MYFPVYFKILGWPVSAATLFDLLALAAGIRLFFYLRYRSASPSDSPVASRVSLWMVVGAVFGALLGSKCLALFEKLPQDWSLRWTLSDYLEGESIVGALLGGWAGIEIARRRAGLRWLVGDGLVLPLMVGLSLWAIGTFLSGLQAHTFGEKSILPWAINFGDSPRHPINLYEIVVVWAIGAVVWATARGGRPAGHSFRAFLAGYFIYRYFAAYITEPRFEFFYGLTAVQVACLGGLIVLLRQITILSKPAEAPTSAEAGTIGTGERCGPQDTKPTDAEADAPSPHAPSPDAHSIEPAT